MSESLTTVSAHGEHVTRLFAEHDTPAHASRDSVHEILKAMSRLGADIRKQTIEYRALVDAIDLHNPPPLIVGELERLHQTLGAMDLETTAIAQSGRRLSQLHVQFDRYMTEIKASVAVAAEPAP